MARPDRLALHAELQELHGAAFGWAMSCCRHDRQAAMETLQVAYERILEGRARFGGQSSFRTWAFGVIRMVAKEQARKNFWQRLPPWASDSDDAPRTRDSGAEGDLRDAQTARTLTVALGQLSERQRETLHLVFYQELSIEEAATAMGISLGSARQHYERGKARLRELLGKEQTA